MITIVEERLKAVNPETQLQEESALKQIMQEIILNALSEVDFFNIAFEKLTSLKLASSNLTFNNVAPIKFAPSKLTTCILEKDKSAFSKFENGIYALSKLVFDNLAL